jgi:purine nucleoside permease
MCNDDASDGRDGAGSDALAPDVVLLPAFDAGDFAVRDDADAVVDADVPHELDPWLSAYGFADAVDVRGANAPVLHTADGAVAMTPTGMGKSAAATTVAACCASPRLDLAETVFLSVGVAGGPPSRTTLGSVCVADAVVDWDTVHRWSEHDAEGGERPVDLLRYRPHDYVHRLDDALVSRALDAARGVDLADDPELDAVRDCYAGDAAATEAPGVVTGATLTGDEFWHGETFAAQAEWLCDAYDAGSYVTTQMEDYATATALDRFGHLARYLSLRAVANFDRPAPEESVRESLDADLGGRELDLALANVARVGRAVVDAVCTGDR